MGKKFAQPYLTNDDVAVHLPISEPGITKLEVHWNFIDLDLEDRVQRIGIYTME